eukprot:GILJ01006703.1.p1 GENE.GILJ01006703.1~~GILJ01006703.1.p1  ORF type:complete len:1596 (+),score=316.84 GILJ01006703.1:423-4790(+)
MENRDLQPNDPVYDFKIEKPEMCATSMACSVKTDCLACANTGCVWIEWDHPTKPEHLPLCISKSHFLGASFRPFPRAGKMLFWQKHQKLTCSGNRNARKEQLFMHFLTSLEFEDLLEMSDRSLMEFQRFCSNYMREALEKEEPLPFWTQLFNRLLPVLKKRLSNGSFLFGTIGSFAFDSCPMTDLLLDSMLEPEAEEFYSFWMLEHGRWSSRILGSMHIEDETERLQKVQRLLELADTGMKTAGKLGIDLHVRNPSGLILHLLNEKLAARDSKMSRLMIPFARPVINEWEYASGKGNRQLRVERTPLSSSLMISDSVQLPPDEDIVKLLIEHGAKPSLITPQGNSALEIAYDTRVKFPESIDRIIDYLFSIEPEPLCSIYYAFLYSKNNDVNRLKTCVSQHPTLLDAIVVAEDGTDHLDRNSAPASLLQAAIDSDQTQITNYLISATKAHNKPLVWGPKPFVGPISNSNLRLVQLMVRLGCKDALGSQGVHDALRDAMMAFARSSAERFADALAILNLFVTGVDVTTAANGNSLAPIDILIHILSNNLDTAMFDEKLSFYYRHSPRMEPFYRVVRPLHTDAANLRPTLLSYAEIDFALRGRRYLLPSLTETMDLYQLTFDESRRADSETDSRRNLISMLWMLLYQVHQLNGKVNSQQQRRDLAEFMIKLESTVDSALIRSVFLSLSSRNVPPTPYGIHSLFNLESIQLFMRELMSLSPQQITTGLAVAAVRNYFWNDLISKLGSGLSLILEPENFESVFLELKSYVQVSALPNQEVILLLNRFSDNLDTRFAGAATVIKAISDGSGFKYYLNAKFKIMNSETWKIEYNAEKTLEKFIDGLTVSLSFKEWSESESVITERYIRYVSSVFKGNNQYHIKLRETVLLQYAIKINQDHGVNPVTVKDRSAKQMLSKTSAEQLFVISAIDAFCSLPTQRKVDSCANLLQAELSAFNYISLVSGTCHKAELTNVLIRAVVSSLTTVDLEHRRPVGKRNVFDGFAVIGGFFLNLFNNELRMKAELDKLETVVPRKGKARAAKPDQESGSVVDSAEDSISKALSALPTVTIQDELADESGIESIDQPARSADKGSSRSNTFCKSTISTLNQFIPSVLLSADQEADFTYSAMSKFNFDPTKLIHNMIEGFATRFNVDFAYAEQPEAFLERVSYQLSVTILDKSYWQKPDLLFSYFTFKSADPKNAKLIEVFKRWVRAVTRLSDESPNDIRYKDEENVKGFEFESIHTRTSQSILRIWQDEEHKISEMTDDPLSLFLIGEYSDGSCQRISSDREYNVGLLGYVVNGNTKLIALDQDPETKIFKGRAAIRLLHYKSVESSQDEPILVLESPYRGLYKGKDMDLEELQRKLLNRAKLIQAAFLKQDINMRLIFKSEEYGRAMRLNMCDRTESIPADATIEMIQGLAPFVYSDFARAQSVTPGFVYPLPQSTAFCLVTKDTHQFLPDE